MDLVALNKNAVFVPTPGQTEQEYLGEYHMKKGRFYCIRQDQFQLKQAFNFVNKLKDPNIDIQSTDLEIVIGESMENLFIQS